LTNFLDANREALETAPMGLFGLVTEEGQVARPGIIFCLRQLGRVGEGSLNPLAPYFLVYVRATGEVRYAYAQARQTLELYRALCANKAQEQQVLHDHFDRLTGNGATLPKREDQVTEDTQFELVTWLVILYPDKHILDS